MHLLHNHASDSPSCCSGNVDAEQLNRSFAIAVLLNIALVVCEAAGGFLSGSVALLADAGHNLSDVAGLILAWGAHWLRGRGGGQRWTYGLRSFTILAATLNAILIVVAIIGVAIESTRRLFEPTEVAEIPVLLVALVAAVLNFATARLLSGNSDDLNVRGAYLHMLADAAVSVAVVIGAVLIMVTDWNWIDPGISLAICVLLSIGTWRLLRESTAMLLNAAPSSLDLGDIATSLGSSPEVASVDDLHVWSVSTTELALTARLCCPGLSGPQQDELLKELHQNLFDDFGIRHSTIEVNHDSQTQEGCVLSPKEAENATLEP